MKREICEYIVDSFDDYAGKKHHIVICAVSSSPDKRCCEKLGVGWLDDYWYTYDNQDVYEVLRMVRLGVAVCNPEDPFDMETGQRIAYRKAKGSEPSLFSTKPGVINKGLVQGLLAQEVVFIKNNPGIVIPGYHDSKARYDKKQAEKKELATLSDVEGNVIQAIIDGVDIQKLERLAKAKIGQLNELATTM